MIGQILGNYKIEGKIGEGGMGAVYRGVDLMLEREVAIKALRPELGSQPQVAERFRSEAVTLARLNHPNIATLYSFFRQGDDYFMVLEYVRGVTLDHVIRQRGALTPDEAIPVFCRVLDGIDHAHRLGIIHRDIKPANMMLTETGGLKVLDFGIARILGTARMTKAGHLIGTIEYMSPEQVRGQETDARSDIYSLGMLLYEMLTGRVPFSSENEYELMRAQVEETPPSPRSLNPAIPLEVERSILSAIAKAPNARFQTAGEFRASLLAAGYGTSGSLDSYANVRADYTTQPLTSPPVSRPSDAPAYSTDPALTPPPAQSQDHTAAPNSFFENATGDTAHPAQPSPAALKETRVGDASALQTSSTADRLKETRMAPSTVAPPHVPAPAVNAAALGGQSFFSRLTWVHYALAGGAALFLLGAVVIIPVVLLATAGRKAPDPSKIQPQALERPDSQTADPPVEPGGASHEDKSSTTTSADSSTSNAATTATVETTPTPAPIEPLQNPRSERGPTETRAARRSDAAKPSSKQTSTRKAASDADERRRKALKALEQ